MTGQPLDPAALFKQQAAIQAATLVKDGMAVGLGTGSTATFVVAELGRRIREEGLRICAIPTSDATEAQAREEGIPLTSFGEHPDLDIAIDGADEIEPGTLNLVKGRGGALLREKIVAAAAKQLVIVADASKYVEHLGMLCPVPVEVVPFGWESAATRLARLGAHVAPRKHRDGSFYLTDEKNLIMDCVFGPIENPDTLSQSIYGIVGVIEHGLFLHMATQTITAGPEGIKILEPTHKRTTQSAP
ncbi:MAG: ribose-5-phosphate isomerase RpiA [Acetobacter sp.]|uniref:ribose-5-phosphate isomerase RpiA n=1 Tax=Acetobacter sp. TaxID=440 RepID=UPI003F9064B4